MHFTYPVIKLLDYRGQRASLDASTNPFATVVLAHLDAQGTRGSVQRRWQAKLALTRRLYTKGYDGQEILNLYRFIDWLLDLPDNEEKLFVQEIRQFEEAQQMVHITSAQRIGQEEGRQAMLRRLVERKFGAVPEALAARLQKITREEDLDAFLDRVLSAKGVADLL